MSKEGLYTQDNQGRLWYSNAGKNYKAVKRTCSTCGKTDVVRNTAKTDLCKSCALKGITKSEEHKKKIGIGNRNKGKGRSDNHGYVLVKQEDHPFADSYGYISEHRLVMEKLIGRFLDPNEIVHHIDGDKSNNKPTNLWLFTSRAEHTRFHNMMNVSTKKSNYVYLAGNISQDTRTYKWREDVEFLTREERLYHKIVIVNPCGNKFDQNMKDVDGGSLEFIKEAKKRSQHLLRAKDYKMINICNVMIVNLELTSPERPLIGTVQELCWAHDVFGIPVIAIVGTEESQTNNPYVQHPWIDECCSAKVQTVEEAVDMLKMFFLDY